MGGTGDETRRRAYTAVQRAGRRDCNDERGTAVCDEMSRRRALQLMGVTSVAAAGAAGCSRATDKSSGGNASRAFVGWYPFTPPPGGSFQTLGGVTNSIPNSIGYLYDTSAARRDVLLEEQKYFNLLADESSPLSADGKTFTYKVRAGHQLERRQQDHRQGRLHDLSVSVTSCCGPHSGISTASSRPMT